MVPSRKEIISILLLITAFICVLNASAFGNILPLHSSYEQVAQQVVNVGTAYICVIYALSTWLYHSNYHRARLEMRLVLVAMILVLIGCNIVSTYFFRQVLTFSKLEKCTEMRHLFSNFAITSRSVSLTLSIISILLLFVSLVMIIVKISMSHRRRRRAQLKEMV